MMITVQAYLFQDIDLERRPIQTISDVALFDRGDGATSARHLFARERRRRLRIGEMLRLATLPIDLPRDQVTRSASGRPSSSEASSPAWARWVRRAIRERLER